MNSKDKIHNLSIKAQFLTMIIEDKKTLEGRLAKPIIKDIREGDFLCFTSTIEPVIVRVTKKEKFKSIEEMLENPERRNKLLPGYSYEDAKNVYYSFTGYKENHLNMGMFVFSFEVKNKLCIKFIFRNAITLDVKLTTKCLKKKDSVW